MQYLLSRFVLIFCLILTFISVTSTFNFLMETPNMAITDSPTDMAQIGNYLRNPIRDIQHLNLLVRSQYLQKDTDNLYMRWFLLHSALPLSIGTYDEYHARDIEGPELNVESNRESFVIVSNMKHIRATAARFVQRAGIFFLIFSDPIIDQEQLHELLQNLWKKHNIFKNYILTVEGVLIYDPFEYDINNYSYGRIIKYNGEQDLERMLFNNMRGYPLRIQIFKSVYARPKLNKSTGKVMEVDGVDGKVAQMLQERMNFTMDLQDPDPDYFGERNEKGIYNGAIGSIINNEIDMCLTGFFVKDYMVPEMVFTVAIYDDQLCIYVPKAKRIPPSILPVFSVGYDLWLGFILSAFACATIWCAIRRLNLWLTTEDLGNLRLNAELKYQFMRIYIDTWVVWVRVNILRFPPFFSERIFIASLCLVSVIFGAIFESSLATVYIHPLYYKDINTLRELDDSGMKIIYKYSSMADDLFFSDTSPLFASLNKKLTHVSNLNADVMADVAENGGKASVTRYTTLMLESLHYLLLKSIWVVPECPKYYTISYVLPKDSPIEETVNALILRSLNGGLIKKWIRDMKTEADIAVMMEHRAETNADSFKVLNINDLQLAFYVVGFGSLMSAISLIIEICLKRRYNKKVVY